ncbi:MAG TPA: hypothetical protein VMK12_00070 [Anaeromyxobacteraceae bacterium]|nr:hypothetical protein [Anaeromyxobacteraceae bacterium]
MPKSISFGGDEARGLASTRARGRNAKVLARLDEALVKWGAERGAIGAGIAEMERDLEELELRHGALREGLVPVVAKRDELAAKKAKALHARREVYRGGDGWARSAARCHPKGTARGEAGPRRREPAQRLGRAHSSSTGRW